MTSAHYPQSYGGKAFRVRPASEIEPLAPVAPWWRSSRGPCSCRPAGGPPRGAAPERDTVSGPFPTLLFLTGSFQGRGPEEGTAIRQGIAESLATGPFSINLPFRALRSDKEEHRVSFGRRVPTSVFGSVSDPEHPRSVDSLPKRDLKTPGPTCVRLRRFHKGGGWGRRGSARDPKTPGPPCACVWGVFEKSSGLPTVPTGREPGLRAPLFAL